MEKVKIVTILNNRDGSVAFIEFVEHYKSKILSKKNFEKRFNLNCEDCRKIFAS